MILHVTYAKHIKDFLVYLEFNDGTKGIADMENALPAGPIFDPLRDTDYFADFQLEEDTLAWPNGADFAPEYLQQVATQSQLLTTT